MKKLRFLILTILTCLLGLFAVACNQTIDFDYNIDFVVDGEVIATVGTDGDKIAMPKNPTKEDYTFDGWYWDDGEWDDEFTLNSILDQPLQEQNHYKVYAKFKSSVYYTVIFDNGDEEITQQIKYGERTALRLNTFEHEDEDYVFNGWRNDDNTYQDGETVFNLCDVGEEIRLSAEWKYVPNYGSYTIKYYPNGGAGEPVTQMVDNNTNAFLMGNSFTAPEYKVFDCWSTTESDWGSNYQAGEKAPFKSNGYELKLYARWKWADNVVVVDPVSTDWVSYRGNTKGRVFVLEENVYLHYPIGTPATPFEGLFLGNGYTIDCSEVRDKKSSQDNKTYGGAFGYIGKNGVVKDVHLKGEVYGEWVGSFATVNLGLIENCSSSVYVELKERDYYDTWYYTRSTVGAAGLVAENGGTIRNCVFNGQIGAVTNNYSSVYFWRLAGLCLENYSNSESGTLENSLFCGELSFSDKSYGMATDNVFVTAITFDSASVMRNNYFTEESMSVSNWSNSINASSVARTRITEKSFYTDVLGWDENDWDFSQLGVSEWGEFECPKPKKKA